MTEFEHVDGKLVEKDTATHHLNNGTSAAAATFILCEDTNAAAFKEKAKKREVMSRSQEKKDEETIERDGEIRKLDEERRNTAKGEKHQLRELSKRIKKMHQGKKKNKSTRKDTADSRRIERHQKYIMHKI